MRGLEFVNLFSVLKVKQARKKNNNNNNNEFQTDDKSNFQFSFAK